MKTHLPFDRARHYIEDRWLQLRWQFHQHQKGPFGWVDYAVLCIAVLLLVGCSHIAPSVDVRQPTTLRPVAASPVRPANGAIYHASIQPLFEDRRARNIGDILTININERLSATQKSNSSVERAGGTSLDVPTLQGLPGKRFLGAAVSATSENKFEGKGEATSNNVFEGTITVTVIDLLPNGHLVVAGEKQIGINRDVQAMRVSGVVNPVTIMAGNTVSSTQVADARIEYRGRGAMNEAQSPGWLARFFMTVAPF
ncbi:MAG: flagellar basal body L-ring protein FlgH [Burkholderiales bacterium]|nr:flagellar basal body L-ring protein FlgH [Burkholderiales bacterium]